MLHHNRVMVLNNSLLIVPHMRTPGHNITIVPQILGFLPEPGREHEIFKINKMMMLFDLLPIYNFQIIKEIHDGVVHRENFSKVMARITRDIILSLRY